jgi:signal transduction histidine kinase
MNNEQEFESINPISSRLGKRIVFILVIISGTITLLMTLGQLYFDYSKQFNDVEKRHIEIRDVHAQLMASSLWDFDLVVLQQRMEGLINLPNVDYLLILSGEYEFKAGTPVTGKLLSDQYPLKHQDPNTREWEQIGTIYIESNAQSIYDSLIHNFLTTLLFNFLKTTIVCYIILIIFHHSIYMRIFAIVKYLRAYNPRHPKESLRLNNLSWITNDKDELGWLADETNKLTGNLSTLYKNIRFQQERLTDFTRAASDWMWETNENNEITYCSEPMGDALNIAPYDKPTFKQIEHSQPFDHLDRLLKLRRDFNHCEVSILINNRPKFLLFQAIARFKDGEFLGYRGTAINISELKQAHIELETVNRNLENTVAIRTQDLEKSISQLKATQTQLIEQEKLAALGGLVAGVSHEVNTPLGIAVTASSVISDVTKELNQAFKDQTLTSVQFAELMERMNAGTSLLDSNLNRAAKLIRDFKQTAVDQVSEQRIQFNIDQVLHSLMSSLHPETRKVPVTPLISGDSSLTMTSLPGVITQVISNLVMNSVHHAFNGQEKPSIEIVFYADNDNIIFEYRDNGIGVPSELHQKIFEPFFTTKRGKGGSGLGLNLVFNLVKQKLSGSLIFDSTVGNGVYYQIIAPQILNIPLKDKPSEP